MFLIVCCIFKKKKKILFLIGFFKPFFLFHFLAFPFKTFVLRIFFFIFHFLFRFGFFFALFTTTSCFSLSISLCKLLLSLCYDSQRDVSITFCMSLACILSPACLIARSHCLACLYMRLRSNQFLFELYLSFDSTTLTPKSEVHRKKNN